MNKGKVFTTIIVILMASIAVGYTATGCILRNESNKSKDDNVLLAEENIKDKTYNNILSKLNFTNSFSSSDGLDELTSTTSGINDNNIFVKTSKKYYEFKCIETPISVRVAYYSKDNYNIIYVLDNKGNVYKFKDNDLTKVIDEDYCSIIEKLNVSNVKNIATTLDNLSKSDKYPAIYIKNNNNKILVSEFDGKFIELKELINKTSK